MESGLVGDHKVQMVVVQLLSTLPVVSIAECVGELLAIRLDLLMHLYQVHLVKQLIHTMSMELV